MHKQTMRRLGFLAAMALWVSAMPADVHAAVGDILRLQGRLVSQAGTPIPDGDYGVTVRFYKGQNDAALDALYSYIDPGVKVSAGLFSISIGAASKLDPKPFYSGEVAWMGMKVGSDEEMPRIALHQVAYALRAAQAADLACSGCVSVQDIDPNVLAPYAKSADLHKVATSGKYEDVDGTPDLTPFAKSAALHEVAATGKYNALEGKPPLAELSVCPPGQLLQGHKPDGKAVCVADADSKYDGKNFAMSNLKCDDNQVVKGIGADGKPICVADQKGEATGKDFALSGKACPPGQLQKAVNADGEPVCAPDQDTKYDGKSFAKSDQACSAGQVLRGINAIGEKVCVPDANDTYDGKNFAKSDQACSAGQVLRGINAIGEKVCVPDANDKYDGKNFAKSDQACSAGQVLRGINAVGEKICVKDADTKYDGGEFATSGQDCGAGKQVRGFDSKGNSICVPDADTKYSGSQFALTNQACPGGHVITGFTKEGVRVCAPDKDTKNTYNGSHFALTNQACPAGQVITGFTNKGVRICAVDKDTKNTYNGSHFALTNQTCPAGQVITGFTKVGVRICAPDKDTQNTYNGSHFALTNQTCPTGQVLKGFDNKGVKICVADTGLNIGWTMGWGDQKSASAGWSASSGWGEPRFSSKSAATATSSANTPGPEWMDFAVPKGARTAYISMLAWSVSGYFDIMLMSKGVWKFHRRIDAYQTVSNSSAGGTHDGNIVVLAATGLDHFTEIRIQNRKGRIYFTGLGFSAEDMHGSTGSGFFHWDNITHKPAIAYAKPIPAGDFSSAEVANLKAGKLDDGSKPWIMPANALTTGEVNNLRAAKLDDGSTPWTNGALHNHTYNVNNAWLQENGGDAHFKILGNSRTVVMRTDGTTQYGSNGAYPFLWLYGGDATGNRLMLLDTSGNLWTKTYGWLHDKFQAKGSYAASTHNHSGVYATAAHNHDASYVKKSGDTMTGQLNNRASGGGTMLLYRYDSYTYSGDMLGAIGFDSTDGNLPTNIHQSSAAIIGYAAETHGPSDKGGRLEFWTSPVNQNDNTDGSKRMVVDGTGVQLGATYTDRSKAAMWRLYDTTNQSDFVHLDRYQVVLTYNNNHQVGKKLDTNRIRDYCDDYDGCRVVIGMIDWYSGGYHDEMAFYSFRFHYDYATGDYRVADSEPWGGTSGSDGDHSERNIANAHDACLLDDFYRVGGTNYNDGSRGLYFTYWTKYSSSTYRNKRCAITFMD